MRAVLDLNALKMSVPAPIPSVLAKLQPIHSAGQDSHVSSCSQSEGDSHLKKGQGVDWSQYGRGLCMVHACGVPLVTTAWHVVVSSEA